jgi:hypothetical protein
MLLAWHARLRPPFLTSHSIGVQRILVVLNNACCGFTWLSHGALRVRIGARSSSGIRIQRVWFQKIRHRVGADEVRGLGLGQGLSFAIWSSTLMLTTTPFKEFHGDGFSPASDDGDWSCSARQFSLLLVTFFRRHRRFETYISCKPFGRGSINTLIRPRRRC